MSAQTKGTPTRIVACCLAFSGFAVAILSGLTSGASTADALSRAMVSLVLCYVAGRFIGLAFEHVVRERVERELAEVGASDKAESAPGRAPNGGKRNAAAA